jgi:biotin-(acetyl-CoA carboxylase) ligase
MNELTRQLMLNLDLLRDKKSNVSEKFRNELWGLHEKRNLFIAETQETIEVKIHDVDEYGRIVVEYENGGIHRFHHGQAYIRF